MEAAWLLKGYCRIVFSALFNKTGLKNQIGGEQFNISFFFLFILQIRLEAVGDTIDSYRYLPSTGGGQ